MSGHGSDLGARLRTARESRGLTVADIAAATKISPTALVAIERGEFERLPGGVFRRGYLRAFAGEVGLDADDIVDEFQRRFEPPAVAELLVQQRATRRHRVVATRRIVATVAVALLLALGLIAWLSAGPSDTTPDDASAPAPAELTSGRRDAASSANG